MVEIATASDFVFLIMHLYSAQARGLTKEAVRAEAAALTQELPLIQIGII